MGEMADAMIDGEMDFFTGEYIGRGVGYPRTLDRSLPWERKAPNAKFGVTNWLNQQGITDKNDQMKVIRKFFPENTENISKEQLCLRISQTFNEFKNFVKTSI